MTRTATRPNAGSLYPLLPRALRSPSLGRAIDEAAASLEAADSVTGRAAGPPVQLTGLTAEAKGLCLAALSERTARVLVVACADDREADRLVRSIRAFAVEPERALYFPAPSLSPYQGVSTPFRVKREEIADLVRIVRGESSVIVTSVRAIARPLPTLADFERRIETLAPGDERSPDALAARLVELGYSRTELVVEPGDFARRGGLVDFFPPTGDRPARVDFFGDFVDSVRWFDVDTQRSEDAVDRLLVPPFSIFDTSACRVALARALQSTADDDGAEASAADRDAKIAALRDGRGFPGEEHLFPAALARDGETTDLADFARAVLVFDEPDRGLESAEHFDGLLTLERETLVANRKVALPAERLSRPASEIEARIAGSPLTLAQLAVERPGTTMVRVPCSSAPHVRDRLPDWGRGAAAAIATGQLVVACAPDRGTLERFKRLLKENDVVASEDLASESGAALALADLEEGFLLPEAGLRVTAGPDAFAPVLAPAVGRRRSARAFLSDFRDLKPGDIVVHSEHGIGRFVGIQAIPFEGGVRETLQIDYQAGENSSSRRSGSTSCRSTRRSARSRRGSTGSAAPPGPARSAPSRRPRAPSPRSSSACTPTE